MKKAYGILMAAVLIMSLIAACQAVAYATGFETAAPGGGNPPAAAIDLTPLMQAVVSLAVSLITAFLIPWIRAKYSYEQRQRIVAAYQTVVYAAEQMFGAGTGEKKLEWAASQLEAKGFFVDRAAIEAEVRKMQSLGAAVLADGKTGVHDENS
jgi:hypothetical protein